MTINPPPLAINPHPPFQGVRASVPHRFPSPWIHFLAWMLLTSTHAILLRPNQSVNAQEVDWLASVTPPPASFSMDRPGRVVPLLEDSEGRPITDWQGWVSQRRKLQLQWLEFLGSMPPERPPLEMETLTSTVVRGIASPDIAIVRRLVRYQGEPGLFVEGYLLYPQHADQRVTPLPGIVALHPTTAASIDEIAGVSGPDSVKTGLKLAERGYVVFCPRCFLWQDVKSFDEAVAKHRQRHPQTTGMAKMLYDAMRGVDVLESLAFVDRHRIGAVGHSLGAKEVLYLMAFDDRVRAGVASEGGLGFRSTNWNAPWYLGTAIDDEAFPLNHHQLLAMIAPRPLLILAGEQGPGAADGDRSWHLINAAIPAWKLAGEPVRLGLLNHHEGHALSDRSFEKLIQWMDTYSARNPAPSDQAR